MEDVMASVWVLAAPLLPGDGDQPVAAPVGHGGTTAVFQASRGGGTVFVRLAEEKGEEMAVEAAVHQELRRRGVRVPEVLAVEPPGRLFDRGALVVTQMPGRPWLEAPPSSAEPVAFQLGADLGRMARVPVLGFGFVERSTGAFTAPGPDVTALLVRPVREALREALGAGMEQVARTATSFIGKYSDLLTAQPSVLAHGDLDGSHVYVDGDEYAGLIDFGEVRGAPPLYDVGHWAVHQAQLGIDVVGSLMAGYAAQHPPPKDWEVRVRVLGVIIGVLLLRLTLERKLPDYRECLAAGIEALVE